MNEQDSEACSPSIHFSYFTSLPPFKSLPKQERHSFPHPSTSLLPPSNPHPHKTVFFPLPPSLPPSLKSSPSQDCILPPPSLPHPHKTVFSPLPPSLPPSPEQDRLFAVLTDAVHEIVERSVQLCHLLQPQQSVITQVGQYSRLHLTQAVLISNQC